MKNEPKPSFTNEDNEAFNEWAFGVKEFYFYRNSSNMMALELWNKRHSDLLVLEEMNHVVRDLEKMLALWEKHGRARDN